MINYINLIILLRIVLFSWEVPLAPTSTLTTTLSPEEIELLDNLGMSEEEARIKQIEHGFTFLLPCLKMLDRQSNQDLYQKLEERIQACFCRNGPNGSRQKKEKVFLERLREIVVEFER